MPTKTTDTRPDATLALSELGARQSQLEARLAALDRAEPAALARIDKAQKRYNAESVEGLRVPGEEFSRELEAAKRDFAELDRERNAARSEIVELKLARLDVIRKSARPAWAGLQRVRAEQYTAAVELAARVEKLVAPFSSLVEAETRAREQFDGLLAPLGLGAFKIRADLAGEIPEVELPNTPEERRALRIAIRLRSLLKEALDVRW